MVLGLPALVLAGVVGWQQGVLPGGQPAAGPGCETTNLLLAAPPAIAGPAADVAAAVSDACVQVEVTTAPTAQVLADAAAGDPLPDLWITDAPWAASTATAAGAEATVASVALASTPVLLVGGPAATVYPSWSAAMASGTVALPEPESDPVGALAVTAPRAEADQLSRSAAAARSSLVAEAQRHSELRADGESEDLSLESVTAASPRVVAITEQAYSATRGDHPLVRLVTPRTGAPLLRFALVTPAGAGEPVQDAARRLDAWFRSDEGLASLAQAGLRPGNGKPSGRRGGAGRVDLLPSNGTGTVLEELRAWQVISVPASMLAVIDVSASMDFAAGDQTRIQMVADLTTLALDIYPDHARIGLWDFSIDRGGPGQDWSVLEPVRRLDEQVGGQTQRDLLRARSAELPSLTTGGTGLYDTTLAAFRAATKAYDPHYYNSLILITDGANDDPGSISLEDLIATLKAEADPQQPVRIIGIGISQDADISALRRICRTSPTGKAYVVNSPEEITQVFAEATSSR